MPVGKSAVPGGSLELFPDYTAYLRSAGGRWKSYAHGSDGCVRSQAATVPEKVHPVEQVKFPDRKSSDASIFADSGCRQNRHFRDPPAAESETDLYV